ncbi:MAG: hypothetical protein JWN90_109 [Parcubacteria group bacterium]|nr:hypothetical protein [Parcubacteria group bacterium]
MYMHTGTGQQPRATQSRGWKTEHARKAFLDAFSGEYAKPPWFKEIQFVPPPHDGRHHLAILFCGVHQARIKVLQSEDSIEGYRKTYPDERVVIIVVEAFETADDIRQGVFSEISSLLGET